MPRSQKRAPAKSVQRVGKTAGTDIAKPKAQTAIRDRVVGLRRVPARDLLANPKNWRRHPESQRSALGGMLSEVGIADALIARETPEGLMLIDGHLRQDVLAHFHPSMHQIIWKKNVPTFAMGRLDYSYQHEPIIYTWRESNREFYGTTQTSIIEIDRPARSPEHATMKPIELIEIFIGNSSKPSETIYDPFLGSGTTLIAAERTGRKCYGMEISEKYVDVSVRRWQNYTGKIATLEATGETFAEREAVAQ